MIGMIGGDYEKWWIEKHHNGGFWLIYPPCASFSSPPPYPPVKFATGAEAFAAFNRGHE